MRLSIGNSLDSEISAVRLEILNLDPNGWRISRVLRNTFDELYDGQETGRFRWDQLFNTERNGIGEILAINFHREFKFEDGTKLDYRIAGIDVDCKFSQSKNGWMIPPEAQGHVCLVVWAEDSANPKWSIGLVRTTVEHLNTGGNRDCKATLNSAGRNSIQWIFKDAPLPPNILLQLDRTLVQNIMALKSGQQRLNALFRIALGKRVGRVVVATLAQQDDYMKRVRGNGGARTTLKPEGIIILGQFKKHCAIADSLGAPAPQRGGSVALRVSPAQAMGPGVVEIAGGLWRIAMDTDPPCVAPELPSVRKKKAPVTN